MRQNQTVVLFAIAIIAVLVFITAITISMFNYNAKKREVLRQQVKAEKL